MPVVPAVAHGTHYHKPAEEIRNSGYVRTVCGLDIVVLLGLVDEEQEKKSFKPCKKCFPELYGKIKLDTSGWTSWLCKCGYAMPDAINQCVKCGAKRPIDHSSK